LLPIKSGLYLTRDRAQLKHHFNLYIKTGGIPEYLMYQRREILENIYNDILFKDIAVRYGLKEITALRQCALFTLSNSGAKISYTALKNTLSLNSPHTVKAYVEYLENSFLASQLHQYQSSLKVQYSNQKKIYSIDTGLMETLGSSQTADMGRKLETIVYLSLRQKNQNIYYYLTDKGMEIDFCVKEGNKITQLIQVADNIENSETKKREIVALEQGLSEHKNASAIIITTDTEDTITIHKKKVRITPIYQWLLEKRI
jgi:predicted AAA+ superfamily ATPase